MKKIVLANWKANLSPAKTLQWLAVFKEQYQPCPHIKVVLAPSLLLLAQVAGETSLPDSVSWAAQDVSSYPPGSYTGSIPAAWLSGLTDYVLVGHRERRRYFHDTVQDAANKVREAVSAELTPILCMDRDMVVPQLAALDSSDIDHAILAYTPDDAESLETARRVDAVAETAAYFQELSGGCPVLYGGGVNTGNVVDLLSTPNIAGVMVAAGSLVPHEFIKLLHNGNQALACRSESGKNIRNCSGQRSGGKTGG